jgi:hypothetical protein
VDGRLTNLWLGCVGKERHTSCCRSLSRSSFCPRPRRDRRWLRGARRTRCCAWLCRRCSACMVTVAHGRRRILEGCDRALTPHARPQLPTLPIRQFIFDEYKYSVLPFARNSPLPVFTPISRALNIFPYPSPLPAKAYCSLFSVRLPPEEVSSRVHRARSRTRHKRTPAEHSLQLGHDCCPRQRCGLWGR